MPSLSVPWSHFLSMCFPVFFLLFKFSFWVVFPINLILFSDFLTVVVFSILFCFFLQCFYLRNQVLLCIHLFSSQFFLRTTFTILNKFNLAAIIKQTITSRDAPFSIFITIIAISMMCHSLTYTFAGASKCNICYYNQHQQFTFFPL